ncbi:MAG TPA: tetratricopeptide repeat protein [Pyrinomonadaceae bacterium]|nr:tetratricopeptide repeat protein [Pyrinomonadaceae bacterium]
MKKTNKIAALVIILYSFSGVRAQTAEPPELKEAGELSAQVVRLYGEKKYDEALPLAKRALKLREEKLGPEHPLVIASLTNLAEVYLAKEKLGEAEPLYQRALAVLEKSTGKPDPRMGQILDRLALVRFAREDYGKAEALYRRALEVQEKASGPESDEVVETLGHLVSLYSTRREYDKAKPVLQRIVSIREKASGPSSAELAASLHRLACVMYRNREDAEAQKVESRANDILYKGKPEPIELPPDLFNCKLFKNPYPKYPARAVRFPGQRVIQVKVEVDETGKVTSARMISGESAFRDSSKRAAMSAELRPTLVGGQPVKVSGIIKYQFLTKTSTVIVGPVPGRPRP